MIKRRFGFLLHCLLLVSLVGYFPAFQIRQWCIRSEMKERMAQNLPDSQLERFSFGSGSEMAKRVGSENEFEYQGEMYDVVRRKISGDHIILYCIHDTRESRLFKELESSVNFRMDSGKYPIRQVFNTLEKIFHSTEARLIKLMLNCETFENGNYAVYSDFYSFQYSRKLTPPPRFSS